MQLQLNEVTHQYRDKYHTVTAVNHFSYTFVPGTFYAIMGKSGSGKTTLLSLLAGLMLPTQGEVLIDGTPTARLDRNRLRRDRISVIYQDLNLFPLLTVEENVTYPLRLRRETGSLSSLVQEKLKLVDIREEQFPRLPVTLSGGEQQRVAIARALAVGSELILADEPTGNLDEENSRNIVRILKDLAHSQERCVIVVTHDPAIGEQADQVLYMKDGTLSDEQLHNQSGPQNG